MASMTLALHCLKTLLGHVLQFDWEKSGTKQLLHAHFTPHLWGQGATSSDNTQYQLSKSWGFCREGVQVPPGAGPCDHSVREEGLCRRRPGKVCTPQPAMALSLQSTTHQASCNICVWGLFYENSSTLSWQGLPKK